MSNFDFILANAKLYAGIEDLKIIHDELNQLKNRPVSYIQMIVLFYFKGATPYRGGPYYFTGSK